MSSTTTTTNAVSVAALVAATTAPVPKHILNGKVTLSYTLKVPITFPIFVDYINKEMPEYDEDGDDELISVDDADVQQLWVRFLIEAKKIKKTLPSGCPVDIIGEPGHEAVVSVNDLITKVIKEAKE